MKTVPEWDILQVPVGLIGLSFTPCPHEIKGRSYSVRGIMGKDWLWFLQLACPWSPFPSLPLARRLLLRPEIRILEGSRPLFHLSYACPACVYHRPPFVSKRWESLMTDWAWRNIHSSKPSNPTTRQSTFFRDTLSAPAFWPRIPGRGNCEPDLQGLLVIEILGNTCSAPLTLSATLFPKPGKLGSGVFSRKLAVLQWCIFQGSYFFLIYI